MHHIIETEESWQGLLWRQNIAMIQKKKKNNQDREFQTDLNHKHQRKYYQWNTKKPYARDARLDQHKEIYL